MAKTIILPFLLCGTLCKSQFGDSVKIEIKNIGISVNSAFADFAPVISADGALLIFTSRRPATEKDIKKNRESAEYIYYSEFDDKKRSWSKPQQISSSVNEPGRNNSAIALSNDAQKMLIYRDDRNGNGDFWETVLKGKVWSEPEKLPEPVNSPDHESSASYSPDGKTIYFISDRQKGKGGRDIWYCTKNSSGKWGKAVNLDKTLNTPSDEEGVFMHPDGKTLYFSSKGHSGLGGYDIFKTTLLSNGKWSLPVNLGKPLNTEGDDVFFVMEANGTRGYYSSTKPGGSGEKDIYTVTFEPKRKEAKSNGPKLTLLKGIVIDEESLMPLEANIVIIDNEKNTEIFKITSNSSTGKFLVSLPAGKNYGINVNAQGYLFHSENFNIPDTAVYIEVQKIVELKKLAIGKKIVLSNIFYDFDKATLRSESLAECEHLLALLNENPTLSIEISSHTDSKGSEEYNLKLSQARAQSVVDYLIGRGVVKNRLVAKGYGEGMPVASNETEDGRQQNRRTEFKILSK